MVVSKFSSNKKSSMRVNERLVIVILCVLSALFFVFMLHTKISYSLLLEKYDELSKINEILQKEGRVKDAPVKRILRPTQKYIPRIVQRENKFKDMTQFTVNNPDFRKLTEWPSRVKYSNKNPTIAEVLNKTIRPDMTSWEKFNLQIRKKHIYEEDSEVLQELLYDMHTQKLVAVEEFPWGLQFKLTVTFENGGRAVFKPQRLPKGKDVNENVLYYSDFERHNAEIAAFHLDRLLGFRKVPPVVGRKVNITSELYPLADDKFYKTFFLSPDANYCFHGRCPNYCRTQNAVCGDPYMIEGSLSAWILPEHPFFNHNLISFTNPWKRTYRCYLKADWEDNPDYCELEVKGKPPFDQAIRLYDVVDLAILDFLTGNMDRPNFEYHKGFGNDSDTTLLHIDNARGFKRPEQDELSILAPLTQCCVVRLSTFNKLYSFHAGPRPLSDLMRESLESDPLTPVLTEPHLLALDRRVDKVLDAINKCIKTNSPAEVFLDDMM